MFFAHFTAVLILKVLSCVIYSLIVSLSNILWDVCSLESTPARQTDRYAELRRVSLSFRTLGAESQSGCSYILCSRRIKRHRDRGTQRDRGTERFMGLRSPDFK